MNANQQRPTPETTNQPSVEQSSTPFQAQEIPGQSQEQRSQQETIGQPMVEQYISPEQGPEYTQNQESPNQETAIDSFKNILKRSPKKRKDAPIPQVRDELTKQVETILEDGLSDVFRELTPVQQQEFKLKGEQTAFAIRNLLKKTHVRVKSVFKLILEWLKLLPGVNKFFLMQEAKIKTDKIMSLRKHNPR